MYRLAASSFLHVAAPRANFATGWFSGIIPLIAGHPIFAFVYDAMLAPSERSGLGDRRAELLAGARGRTLELGAGTGVNASHYSSAVSELVFTEPDPHMARRLRKRLSQTPPPAEFEVVEAPAERLPFPDDSFDTVVAMLVLCSVSDPGAATAEIVRVLRPDGSLIVFEHVRDPGAGALAGWQDRLERPWGWFTGRCHPNRDTGATLRAAGFDVAKLEPDQFPKAPPLVRPVVRGTVTRSDG